MRVVQHFLSVCRNHELVRVDHVGVIVNDRLGCAEDGLRLQQVVMIQEHHKGTGGHGNSLIGRARYAFVLVGEVQFDAGVFRSIGFQNGANVRLCGAIVCNTELPVGVHLVFY